MSNLKFYKRVTVNGDTRLLHRIVAEKMIGRKLADKEVVHHIDEDKQNNEPSNLMVMRSRADHGALHQGLTPQYDADAGHWFCDYGRRARRECEKCSASISYGTQDELCLRCHNEKRRSELPTADELISLINRHNGVFVSAAKECGISDRGLAARCAARGLPRGSRAWKKSSLALGQDGYATSCNLVKSGSNPERASIQQNGHVMPS